MSNTVDILILNRNYGHFLEDSIESCLEQTHKDINIIIADDNSTDNSREILKKYKNIKNIFINDEKPNIAKTRNILVKNSNNNYCCFLSSDDYFHKDFIKYNLETLLETETPNNNIGGIYSNFDWIDENKNFINQVNNPSFINKEQLHSVCSQPSCIVTFESSIFLRKIFDINIQFCEDILHGEETYFIYEITKHFHFIKNSNTQSLAFKRKHINQGHNEYLRNQNYFLNILKNKILENK